MSAFWGTQSWSEGPSMQAFKLCPTLTEEVVTCLLGGHGAPAEVGLAAAARVIAALRDTPDAPLSRERAEELLTTPLEVRSEEHTSELQSLMRISYAVFCLKKKN